MSRTNWSMDVFVNRLRQRTKELGLTNADVARRLDLNDRTYGHYVTGRRQPNLQTLARIAKTLQTSTDFLLGLEPGGRVQSRKEKLAHQAQSAVMELSDEKADMAVKILRVLERG